MSRVRTHYDDLKVARDAPPEVIRAAYRSLSLKYHPDYNPGDPRAARIMASIRIVKQGQIDPGKIVAPIEVPKEISRVVEDVPQNAVGTATVTTNDAEQDYAVILFYRPITLKDSDQNPTIYAIRAGGNKKLATVAKGEFFALKVQPGIYAYSWTYTPARGQQTTLNVSSGQQVFIQLQFRDIIQTATDAAPPDFQALRPIDVTRVFDSDVWIPEQSIKAP